MSMRAALFMLKNNSHIATLKGFRRNPTQEDQKRINGSFSSDSSDTSMGKTTTTSNLNSSISNSTVAGGNGLHMPHANYQQNHLPTQCMNSKRKHAKYMYLNMYPEHNNYLHLNSLWSIWYGVLLTLYQGYLAVHGAYRFLGCSLIPWKIEPVTELNLQIILSGLVFILLPFFFTSAVFKVGNLANDGVKLAAGTKGRKCTMSPDDGLEEEARGGTLRALWTHGGPTAAFVHIVIALCLLLPRLLLEARIIENGVLPRESIWQTELDFVSTNRRHLVALSVVNSHSANDSSSYESHDEEDYFNDTLFSRRLETTAKRPQHTGFRSRNAVMSAMGRSRFLEVPDLVKVDETKFTDRNYESGFDLQAELLPGHESTNIETTQQAPATHASFVETSTAKATLPTRLTSTTPKSTVTNDVTTVGQDTSSAFTTTYSTSTVATPLGSLETTTNAVVRKSHPPHNSRPTRKHGSHHRQRKVSTAQGASHQRRHRQHHTKRLGDHNRKPNVVKETMDSWVGANGLDDFDDFASSRSYESRPAQYEELDFGRAMVAFYPKSSTTTSSTTRDSNIHIVKPEKLPEIIPSTPVSSDSKIIEIRSKSSLRNKRSLELTEASQVKIEPEYLIGELSLNDSSEYLSEVDTGDTSTPAAKDDIHPDDAEVRLGGFAGMLQLFFGIEKPIDVAVFAQPPSAEFLNLVFALLVWCVRYPAVFWTTTKSFATVFSVQMIATAADIIFSYVGISSLLKLQIYSEAQPVVNKGLVLNATVTLALFLLSTVLMLSSSMIMYLYGHGRLAARMRNRSIISLKSGDSWIYFAHCASLCYVLSLAVVKAPLLNDLCLTYRHNRHSPTFMAALASVADIILWIVIWISLTFKRKWNFKLPPLDAYTALGKATTQPLLMHNRGSITNTASASLNNSTNLGGTSSSSSNDDCASDHKMTEEHTGNHMLHSHKADGPEGCGSETATNIYWPKLAPNSPKLKVTFNEVTSTSDDDSHHQLLIDRQNDGKRNSTRGAAICFASAAREIDDGEYATLRAAPSAGNAAVIVGDLVGVMGVTSLRAYSAVVGAKDEVYDQLPAPPQHMTSSMVVVAGAASGGGIGDQRHYVNFPSGSGGSHALGDDTSEEGKLLASVRDDSVTYACSRDLEPPLPPPPPSSTPISRHSSAVSAADRAPQALPEGVNSSNFSDHLVSPLAPVTVTVQTNEAHITCSSTPRCLRRGDSGVPQEALTPRSDTTSTGTESTTSPPERAPSESSSGVHSAEEREVEVVIRPRASCKPPAKPPQPAIQEEPYGRCTNMRMSSFASGSNSSSATLPPQRSQHEPKFDYSQHCSTMPLPSHSHDQQAPTQMQPQQVAGVVYATSAHCMTQSLNVPPNVSSFKTPLYANSGVTVAGYIEQPNGLSQTNPSPQLPHLTHITLPNGVRYSNPNILRRLPHVKGAESPYGHLGLGAAHHAFYKHGGYEGGGSLFNATIPEDRDSANYSMSSDQDCLYATANPLH